MNKLQEEKGNQSKIKIGTCLILLGQMGFNELQQRTGISRPVLAKHLARFVRNGSVRKVQSGNLHTVYEAPPGSTVTITVSTRRGTFKKQVHSLDELMEISDFKF
jgi:predicted DNA-binding transcriptional regulator